MNNNNTATYSINIYGSNPDSENDDCWTCVEFDTKHEALAAYNDVAVLSKHLVGYLRHNPLTEGEYVEIDGPDVNMSRPFRKGEWTLSRRQKRIGDGYAATEAKWECRMLTGRDDY